MQDNTVQNQSLFKEKRIQDFLTSLIENQQACVQATALLTVSEISALFYVKD